MAKREKKRETPVNFAFTEIIAYLERDIKQLIKNVSDRIRKIKVVWI